MAKKTKIQMSNAGVQALLKSSEVQAELSNHAQGIASRAGVGYEVVAGDRGKTRSRVWVVAESYEAMIDNARNATLARALGGG